ncbi:polysaccharide biosynthesis protein CapD [Sphingobacterium mizutaii NBRC 14946 = DSM 11724]|uniref:UDP-glucose 4-epimerase n=2 Tax=Sphingobacterium mizutaii TaxID=1010 RepID=A0AAJ4XEM3_9SPHI|nr:nucleoside-diphosphate sugar epimerase/dehydratase [Sphingobacterium mizutaii]GEM66509.1 polysaccharide biosynthesis protein CapD [Sphingobacterium mizutaii NBRC 14946 = DSM 11724]SDL52653.1 NDP-sugar epimerase, includes UDP-GlcNAc-inverting 4,6-dehydratase FlaA1 and capsular polysaccharide biosynthesis protein EpsC [Sphingobacterium mizutaii]SNV62618.1 UDP-glucose 4-epimerase [Sphingobacterium mizutaii]
MDIVGLRKYFKKDSPRWVILLIDMMIVIFCYYLSNFVVNSFKGRFTVELMVKKSILIGAVYYLSFLYFKTYRGIVRQAGFRDAWGIFKAVFAAWAVLMLVSTVIRFNYERTAEISEYLRPSYAVLFTHAFFTTVCLVAARIFYRTIYESFFFGGREVENVLIFGAGNMGNTTLNLLRNDTRRKVKVVAFADDNPNRIGKMINGYKIISMARLTKEFVEKLKVDSIIIALDDNNKDRVSRISSQIEPLPVKLKIMPTSARLMSGKVATRQLRTLKIDDLLGREAIKLENPVVHEMMRDRVILVTGGAGSIGSELVRQISFTDFDKLIVIDQAESALYDIQQELRANCHKDTLFMVGNVRDRQFMESVFEHYMPQIVFHAAAYKHVPLMEQNPYESILTNVWGSKNLADMADKYGVEKFVMVSTDKAVNPTNVMGATKRAAEIYVSALNRQSKTNFIVTRFGNVLGSNGSVIPLFEKQLKRGGPLTVTHQDITRYFMTIPEACQLVQEAAVMGQGGEIYVFDMGQPVKIMDLAIRMIRLKGYNYPEDIGIEVTGLRPGEKIYEELLADNENTTKTHHQKIMIARVRTEELDVNKQRIEHLCAQVANQGANHNPMVLVELIKEIVPEYISQNSVFEQLDKHITNQE